MPSGIRNDGSNVHTSEDVTPQETMHSMMGAYLTAKGTEPTLPDEVDGERVVTIGAG